jgi:hypothetical protein
MKRAIAVTELVLILLAAGAGIGLLFFAQKGVGKVACVRDVELCENSYAFYQRWRALGYAGIAPRVDCIAISPPNCEEKVLKTGDKNKTMHIIAENLRHCWGKTLGRQNQMGEDFAVNIFGKAGTDVDFCLVCSEFVPKVSITPKEWNDYLDTRKVPDSQQTYEELIDPVGPTIWERWGYRDIGFTEGTKYYVVSVSAETIADGQVHIYIDPQVYCGPTAPQVHYQLR